MAKKKKPTKQRASQIKPAKKASRPATPASLRKKLAGLDGEITGMLNERARAAAQLAKLRQEAGEGGFEPYEETESIEQAVAASKGPLSAEAVGDIFRELVSGCRAISVPTRVAYLGPQYSYSYLAAVERFGQSADLVPVATIGAVFDEVDRGGVEFGVVPIENSTDGRIADTLARFARLPVRICAEVQLQIHHYLLGRCSRAEVREVFSKPQALSQCREWIAQHLPQAVMVEIASTTAAAQLAAERQGVAAVASRQAGVAYGLNVLAEQIEDNPHNVTRFAVIGDAPAHRTGRDKTALMFELNHKPGALADATAVFRDKKLNLTWIESFPLPDSPKEYLFFVELEGHQNDARVKQAIEMLGQNTTRLDVLGSYAQTEPVG